MFFIVLGTSALLVVFLGEISDILSTLALKLPLLLVSETLQTQQTLNFIDTLSQQ